MSRVGEICLQNNLSPSRFFADALVRTHLNGRLLPPDIHRAIVGTAQTRFDQGSSPVLNAELRLSIDGHAVARDGGTTDAAAANDKTLAAFERLAARSR